MRRTDPSKAATAAERFGKAYGDIILTRLAHVLATGDIWLLESGLVELSGMNAATRGQGYGSRLLCELIDLADDHGVSLLAEVRPQDPGGAGIDRLVAWFGSFGFELSNRSPSDRPRHPFERLSAAKGSALCRIMVRESGVPGITLLEKGRPFHVIDPAKRRQEKAS